MTEIFISYRRNDSDQIRSLINALERCGLRIFIADDTYSKPEHWDHRLREQVGACDIVVVLWSRTAFDRPSGVRIPDTFVRNDFVRREISAALQQQIPTIPVMTSPPMHELQAEIDRLAALPDADILARIDPQRAIDNIADLIAESDLDPTNLIEVAQPDAKEPDTADPAENDVDQAYCDFAHWDLARQRYQDFIDHQKIQEGLASKWKEITNALRDRLGDEIYSTWFDTLEAESTGNGELTISVPTEFLRTHIVSHYTEDLLYCCRAACKQFHHVEIVLQEQPKLLIQNSYSEPILQPEPRAARPANFAGPAGRAANSTLSGEQLDPKYTFETFLVSASNRIAHSGAVLASEVALRSVRNINPLFIYASDGSGKTHLLQSMARHAYTNQTGVIIVYCTAERFGRELSSSAVDQSLSTFRKHYLDADIVLIDDIDLLQSGRPAREFELMANKLLSAGKKLIGCAARAPDALEALTTPLRTIFAQGLVAEIRPPEPELRMRLIEQRVAEYQARDGSFQVSPDIMQLIAVELARSGRHIDSAVAHLFTRWSVERRALTRDGVRSRISKLLRDLEPRHVKVGDVMRLVARHFSVSRTDIVSDRRTRSAVWARRVGMYLARNLKAGSVPEIGRRFGGRDEAAVLRAVRKVELEIGVNPSLREEIETLKRAL